MRCLMQVDEVLAVCFNVFTYLSLSMSGWLLRPMCCVSVRRDYGSVSGFVGLFVCIFAASCLVSKITKLGGKCEESWVVNYGLYLETSG